MYELQEREAEIQDILAGRGGRLSLTAPTNRADLDLLLMSNVRNTQHPAYVILFLIPRKTKL